MLNIPQYIHNIEIKFSQRGRFYVYISDFEANEVELKMNSSKLTTPLFALKSLVV